MKGRTMEKKKASESDGEMSIKKEGKGKGNEEMKWKETGREKLGR